MASTDSAPIAGIADEERHFYGLQFHPEVTHTRQGQRIIERFVHDIVGCGRLWTPGNIIDDNIQAVRELVGDFVTACNDRQFRVKAIYHVIRAMR